MFLAIPMPRCARSLRLAVPGVPLALGGCSAVVLHPAGAVAQQQAAMIWWSVGLMLLIIVPVMVLTVLFAWRYREGNATASYAPDWDHSTGLELVIWAAPLLIIIALGALTWTGTHLLDPFRPLDRAARQGLSAAQPPLEVEVVSLDWKWLFIYPEQGIATVNRLVLPVDRPVRFRMTSSSVMNTFWVPAMAGMIYTMPGMETRLHAVLNRAGDYDGRSGNYSGAGFSGMTFKASAVAPAQFDRWVAGVRAQPRRLDRASYLALEKPSENVAPIGFGGIDTGLYGRIVAMCVNPGTTCMDMSGMGRPAAAPPVNNRPAMPGEPAGALLRHPEDKGVSPYRDVPRGRAPGQTRPGSQANRNLTLLVPHPSATAAA